MVKVNKVRDILGKWLRISLRKKYHGHFVDMARKSWVIVGAKTRLIL